MYFLFYAQGFDDALKFAYLKIENLILSRTKRAFEVKNTFENIFPSFTSALFRLKKQTNKNVMDTTFDVFVKNSDVFQWDGKPGAKFFHTFL